MKLDHVAVVGAGRVGLSLARALSRSGSTVTVLSRRRADWATVVATSDVVLVAVPDDAITDVARALAGTAAVVEHHVVLHTSGLHDRSALAPLELSGAALGSWHPLQTFSARAGDPDALAGSPVVIEGDARALAAGHLLAAALGLAPVVEMAASGKTRYHAAAVFASNYLVVLADIAERLARDAGAGDGTRELFLPLMRRTLDNFGSDGAHALTGPIRRGDVKTVARHLESLNGAEHALYVALGQEALRMAREAGLDPDRATAIEALLTVR